MVPVCYAVFHSDVMSIEVKNASSAKRNIFFVRRKISIKTQSFSRYTALRKIITSLVNCDHRPSQGIGPEGLLPFLLKLIRSYPHMRVLSKKVRIVRSLTIFLWMLHFINYTSII